MILCLQNDRQLCFYARIKEASIVKPMKQLANNFKFFYHYLCCPNLVFCRHSFSTAFSIEIQCLLKTRANANVINNCRPVYLKNSIHPCYCLH